MTGEARPTASCQHNQRRLPRTASTDTRQTASEPVLGGIVAYLQVDGAVKAAEFYERAFGARIATVHPSDEKGRTMHVHLHLNGSSLMLSDPFPEHGHGLEKPQGFSLMLMVPDIDARFERAVAEGATAVMPPADMFWGDRYGQLRDPFGVLWAMNSPIAR
jgi:PhnB protein